MVAAQTSALVTFSFFIFTVGLSARFPSPGQSHLLPATGRSAVPGQQRPSQARVVGYPVANSSIASRFSQTRKERSGNATADGAPNSVGRVSFFGVAGDSPNRVG